MHHKLGLWTEKDGGRVLKHEGGSAELAQAVAPASGPVFPQESSGAICFCVRPLEITKIAIEIWRHNWYAFGDKKHPILDLKMSYLLAIWYADWHYEGV